jgi:hypothetical protein
MDQIIADCRGSFVLKFIITPASGILSEKPEKYAGVMPLERLPN